MKERLENLKPERFFNRDKGDFWVGMVEAVGPEHDLKVRVLQGFCGSRYQAFRVWGYAMN